MSSRIVYGRKRSSKNDGLDNSDEEVVSIRPNKRARGENLISDSDASPPKLQRSREVSKQNQNNPATPKKKPSTSSETPPLSRISPRPRKAAKTQTDPEVSPLKAAKKAQNNNPKKELPRLENSMLKTLPSKLTPTQAKPIPSSSSTSPKKVANFQTESRPSTPEASVADPSDVQPPSTTSPRQKTRITYLTRTPTNPNLESASRFPSSTPPSKLLQTESQPQPTTTPNPTPPRSPSKPAKDLSDLFEFPMPASPTKGKGKAKSTSLPKTKRMLSRTGSMSGTSAPALSGSSHSQSQSSLASSSSSNIFSGMSTTSSLRRIDTVPDFPTHLQPEPGPFSRAGHSPQRSRSSSNNISVRPSPTPKVSFTAPTAAPPAANPVRRTYAGASRSFLVALPASSVLGARDAFDEQLEDEARESYTTLRARYGIDESSDPPDAALAEDDPDESGTSARNGGHSLPNGMMNDLKSITEMRSKGETRRFVDEVGYLLEGLTTPRSALTIRRGSALEVLGKLNDEAFWTKAKKAGMFGKFWEGLRAAEAGEGDKILDTALALFTALVARDPRDLFNITTDGSLPSTLIRLLDASDRMRDPLGLIQTDGDGNILKRIGVGKAEKPVMEKIKSIIVDNTNLFPDDTPISTRLLLSYALSALPPSLLTSSQLHTIYASLLAELLLLPPRVSAFTSGLDLWPPGTAHDDDMPSLVHAEHCLRILDAFLLGQCSANAEGEEGEEDVDAERLRERMWEDKDKLVDGLVALAVVAGVILRDMQYEDLWSLGSRCVESSCRILINLTNNSADWGRVLLQNDFTLPALFRLITSSQRQWRVKKEEAELDLGLPGESEPQEDPARIQSMDHLCFALGVLTNLVQAVPQARDAVRELALNVDCAGKRTCIHTCRCTNRGSSLRVILSLYTDLGKPSELSQGSLTTTTVTENHFLQGHLAVLIGLLMIDSPQNQDVVLECLPSRSRRAKLDGLVEMVKEFGAMFVALAARICRGADGEPRRRLADIDDADRSAQVTSDVLVSLERLRDESR